MIRIALTGSIGMGKSTVARMFESAGIPVFDADAVVRQLQGPGGELVEAIEMHFPGTAGPDGIDRDALSKQVLSNPEDLARLEAIVHPGVHRVRAKFLLDNQDRPALLFEIPLLYETGGGEAFDQVIVVSAPAEVQRERVLARPGMTDEKLHTLLARQMPDQEKRERADFVVDTSGDLSTTENQVRHILTCLGLGSGG
ncbi:MAG: dephospho-CoA kinase [Sphingomonas sp.]|nr:dephospho-CoA kinase [Sphingomonas sp.]